MSCSSFTCVKISVSNKRPFRGGDCSKGAFIEKSPKKGAFIRGRRLKEGGF